MLGSTRPELAKVLCGDKRAPSTGLSAQTNSLISDAPCRATYGSHSLMLKLNPQYDGSRELVGAAEVIQLFPSKQSANAGGLHDPPAFPGTGAQSRSRNARQILVIHDQSPHQARGNDLRCIANSNCRGLPNGTLKPSLGPTPETDRA